MRSGIVDDGLDAAAGHEPGENVAEHRAPPLDLAVSKTKSGRPTFAGNHSIKAAAQHAGIGQIRIVRIV